MVFTLSNSKKVTIPDKELNNLMSSLDISKEEAIELWLCDNGYDEDEEQQELDEKASKIKILKDISQKKPKKERKPVKKVASDEKQALFAEILGFLKRVYGINTEIVTENKLITVKIGDRCFKIDIIEQRKPKNK
jgi:hypothetical protein